MFNWHPWMKYNAILRGSTGMESIYPWMFPLPVDTNIDQPWNFQRCQRDHFLNPTSLEPSLFVVLPQPSRVIKT